MVNTSSYDVDKMNSYKPATLRMTRPTERHRLTSVCEYSLEMLFVLTPPHPLPFALPSKQLHEAIFCGWSRGQNAVIVLRCFCASRLHICSSSNSQTCCEQRCFFGHGVFASCGEGMKKASMSRVAPS